MVRSFEHLANVTRDIFLRLNIISHAGPERKYYQWFLFRLISNKDRRSNVLN